MTTFTAATTLPAARGPLSESVLGTLLREQPRADLGFDVLADTDPLGDDLQLALHLCYELHYQGLPGVSGEWEWDPELLRLRGVLESRFLAALRENVAGGDDVTAELDALLVEPLDAEGLSHFLRDHGEWQHVRELLHPPVGLPPQGGRPARVGDPAAARPRQGGAGGGGVRRVRRRPRGAGCTPASTRTCSARPGLPDGYLELIDHVPGSMLAVVNMMSLFGLHRSLRGALCGHFAAAEITTGRPPTGSTRPCGGWARPRRAGSSTPSTSRRTRSTNR